MSTETLASIKAAEVVTSKVFRNGPSLLNADTLEALSLLSFNGESQHFESPSRQHQLSKGDLETIITTLANIDFETPDTDQRRLTDFVVNFALFFHYKLDALQHVLVTDTLQTSSKRGQVRRIWKEKVPRDKALAHQLQKLEEPESNVALLSMATLKLSSLSELRRRGYAPGLQPYLLSGHPNAKKGTRSAAIFTEYDQSREHFYFTVVDVEKTWNADAPKLIHFDTLSDNMSEQRARDIYQFCKDAFVAPMTRPFDFQHAQVIQRGGWSCGYQILRRANSVARWLEDNRVDSRDRGIFNDQSPLLSNASLVAFQNVSELQCQQLYRTLFQLAANMYLYIVRQSPTVSQTFHA
ncbi:MAG: hypothetical protein LC650_01175 [Actinobacteria bacterium]|nr:hypothetical protein [Actinomycetota bacterium]